MCPWLEESVENIQKLWDNESDYPFRVAGVFQHSREVQDGLRPLWLAFLNGKTSICTNCGKLLNAEFTIVVSLVDYGLPFIHLVMVW